MIEISNPKEYTILRVFLDKFSRVGQKKHKKCKAGVSFNASHCCFEL